MKIQRMKTNRIVNPLGFDLKTPHVSWTVTDTEAKKQLWARGGFQNGEFCRRYL